LSSFVSVCFHISDPSDSVHDTKVHIPITILGDMHRVDSIAMAELQFGVAHRLATLSLSTVASIAGERKMASYTILVPDTAYWRFLTHLMLVSDAGGLRYSLRGASLTGDK
jgi:hypothetical protein